MIGSETDGGIVPLTMENIFTAIENLDEDRNFLLGYAYFFLKYCYLHYIIIPSPIQSFLHGSL
jgi:hypothetical protein